MMQHMDLRSLGELHHTPSRTVRIPTRLWDTAKQRAEAEGLTISTVIRGLLAQWLSSPPEHPFHSGGEDT